MLPTNWTQTMTEFTNRELADCAHREVKQRLNVYPRLVHKRSMSQALADRQIKMMKAIAAHFDQLAEADEAKERLL